MDLYIKKSCHSKTYKGICGSNNNCYYKGSSVTWEIRVKNSENTWLEDTYLNVFKTKKKATLFIKWVDTTYPNLSINKANYINLEDLFEIYCRDL